MKRRKFIQLSALGSAGSLLLNGHRINAFSQTALLNNIPSEVVDGRSLVLVQLVGGNDGLNTLIPLNQYDRYAQIRPTLKLDQSGENAAIPLDNTLPLKDQILLHPALSDFKNLYEAGKLNIIRGVGYPVGNKSHFAGRALMFKGGDGTPENANKNDGWMARFLHAGYDPSEYQDPLGIQLGSKKPSLGFHSSHEHKVDINLTGQDVSDYYSVISNHGNPTPTNLPNSEYAENIDFISKIESSANEYSERISSVFKAGSNHKSYPNHDLANQLKTVARLIKGGSKTKIFLVSIGGFDTHSDQVPSGSNNNHQGTHAQLLQELGESVQAFQEDLEGLGIDEKVVTTTFTEFGRKPVENGSYGTDHGNLGPMFVIGKHVKGGISGENLDLSKITAKNHFDEANMQHDYRQVFTSLLSDFMGGSQSVINTTEFEAFDGDRKIDLIANAQKVDGNLSVDSFEKEQRLSLSPNPTYDRCTLQFKSPESFRGQVLIYNLNGKLATHLPQDFVPGMNVLILNLEHLKSGTYLLAIKDGFNQTQGTFKLLKK